MRHGNPTTIRGDHNTTTTHNYGDNNTTYNYKKSKSGLSVLRSQVAFSALHDSEARYPQPNVLHGTRQEILRKLSHWVEDPFKKNKVYWINGAAGVGKSAIAQALSEKYIRTGQLAAAFFFSRNDPARDKLDPFAATIAFQLATSKALKPHIAPLIDHTIRSMPEILHKNWEHQFRTLNEEPCAQVDPRYWSQLPRLIIIDGVDECIELRSQDRLLQMIQHSTPTLPLDFLIFSRPEPHISHIFRHESFIPNPLHMALGDFAAVWDDIEKYIRHEFARIRERHWHTLPSPQGLWPGDSVIHELLCKATGQFIYATTAMKYVDTGKVPITPGLRLEVILRADRLVNSSSPYPDLDLLYSQILQSCVNEGGKLQKILQLIVSPFDEDSVLKSPFRLRSSPSVGLRSLSALEQLLDLSEGEAAALLSGLHSILHIPSFKIENVEVRHASFSEFLLDQHRAGVYYAGPKLSSPEWSQILVVGQVRMLSRFCNESECWSMHARNLPVNGIHDADIGSLNAWKYLYDNQKTIAINIEIATALNAFDPHTYLAMLLHWNYEGVGKPVRLWTGLQLKDINVSRFSYPDENPRDWQHCTVAVNYQINMFYSVFQLLKESHKSYPTCLDKFFKKCSSFFRGFCVSFPRNKDKSVQYTLLACQLSISRHIYHDSTDEMAIFDVMCLELAATLGPFYDSPLRIVSSDNDDGRHPTVPARLQVKYVDPVEGQLLRRVLELLMFNPVRKNDEYRSEMARRIMDVFSSSEFETWSYGLAQLDWGKTRRTYYFGKLVVHIAQRKRRISKVVLRT